MVVLVAIILIAHHCSVCHVVVVIPHKVVLSRITSIGLSVAAIVVERQVLRHLLHTTSTVYPASARDAPGMDVGLVPSRRRGAHHTPSTQHRMTAQVH